MKTSKPCILIIEDETAIRQMLKLALETADFSCLEAGSTKQAQQQLMTRLPNLILLDWMLPGQSGVEYIKTLRMNSVTRHIPIILLTARAEEENKIIGLNSGADDYITKPFSPRELISRIKTVLRRGPIVNPDAEIKVRDFSLNTQTHQVKVGRQSIHVTPKNFALLHFFVTHADRVCSREQLLNHIWGLDSTASDRTVDVYVRRLRKILAPYGYDHWIHTVHSLGYRFSPDL